MRIDEIETIKQLANELRCRVEFLENVLEKGYLVVDNEHGSELQITGGILKEIVVVERFKIPKKNKKMGVRVIYKPHTSYLSETLKILNNSLSEVFIPSENIQGFVGQTHLKFKQFFPVFLA